MYICIISIHVTIIDTIHCSRKAARLSNEILLCFNKERIHWAIEGHSLLNEKEKKLFLGALNTDAFPQKLTWLQKRVPSKKYIWIHLPTPSWQKLCMVVNMAFLGECTWKRPRTWSFSTLCGIRCRVARNFSLDIAHCHQFSDKWSTLVAVRNNTDG